MLSNLLSQLKQMNALDRFDEALVETPKVRKDMMANTALPKIPRMPSKFG